MDRLLGLVVLDDGDNVPAVLVLVFDLEFTSPAHDLVAEFVELVERWAMESLVLPYRHDLVFVFAIAITTEVVVEDTGDCGNLFLSHFRLLSPAYLAGT